MKKFKLIVMIYFLFVVNSRLSAQGIEITDGAKIVVTGTAKIEIIDGNFKNNGTYTMGTENFIFSGSTLGNISGSSNNDFYHLTVNNSNGVTHSSTGYVAVNNLLTFSQGLFNTGINYLIINDNATCTGASTTKYINGNCRKVGNDAFVFPLGNLGKYAPIAISAPLNVTDHFTATYVKTNPNPLYDISLLEVGLNNVSKLEYWTLTRTNGSSNVAVSLYWDNASVVKDLSSVVVARWDGAMWINEGQSAVSGDTIVGNVTSLNEITSFTQFTLGSINGGNPLPIDLLSFNAICDNGKSIINWSTATETNCDYFKIEKLVEGEKDFNLMTTVPGSGNSHQITNYQIEDDGFVNTVYYRLSQVDFNGNETVFNQTIAYSKCGETIINEEVKLYENNGNIFINYNANDGVISEIKIVDLNGRLVYHENNVFSQGINKIGTEQLNLAKGMYLVNFNNSAFNTSIKMIVR